MDQGVKSFIKTAVILTIVGVFVWLTGLILILVTRLFWRFDRIPSFKEAFWTGAAAWTIFLWIFLPPSGQEKPRVYSADPTTYEIGSEGYEYTKDKTKDGSTAITFIKAPLVYYLENYESRRNANNEDVLVDLRTNKEVHLDTESIFIHKGETPVKVSWYPGGSSDSGKPKLYAFGPVDGKNKVFTISTSPDKMIQPTLDLGEEHGLNISVDLGDRLAHSKTYYNKEQRVFNNILLGLVLFAGAISFTSAQLKALTN